MRDYITGIWTSAKNRVGDELEFIKNEFSSEGREEYSKAIGSGRDFIDAYKDIAPDEARKTAAHLPTYSNAAIRSFTSKGSAYAAGIGAAIGGTYGAMSSDSGIMSSAMTMGAIGYLGRGAIGMARERSILLEQLRDIQLSA